MQMVVTVRSDALVKSFVRVVIAVPADAVAEAVAVGCAAVVAAAPAAAAVVPAPAVAVVAAVVVVVVVAAASSEMTSETLPWIFRRFLQSTNKEKMDEINVVEFYLKNKGAQGLKNCDIPWYFSKYGQGGRLIKKVPWFSG